MVKKELLHTICQETCRCVWLGSFGYIYGYIQNQVSVEIHELVLAPVQETTMAWNRWTMQMEVKRNLDQLK